MSLSEPVKTEFRQLLRDFSSVKESFGECAWDDEIYKAAIRALKTCDDNDAEYLGKLVVKSMRDYLVELAEDFAEKNKGCEFNHLNRR